MDKMAKTLVFTGERQIELREYPIPEVSDNKVLVSRRMCNLHMGTKGLYRCEKSGISVYRGP